VAARARIAAVTAGAAVLDAEEYRPSAGTCVDPAAAFHEATRMPPALPERVQGPPPGYGWTAAPKPRFDWGGQLIANRTEGDRGGF